MKKVCTRCGKNKALTSFYKRSENGNPRAYCIFCHKKHMRKYYVANIDRIFKKNKEWASENRDKVREKALRYYYKNRKKIAAKMHVYNQDRVKANARHQRWLKKNPDAIARYNALRCSRVSRKAMPKWADRLKIAAIYKQAKQLTKKTGVVHHVDHVIPLVHPLVCGLHNQFNLRILFAKDNIKKSNHFGVRA